jgi:hypothetical protein
MESDTSRKETRMDLRCASSAPEARLLIWFTMASMVQSVMDALSVGQ